MLQNVVVSVWAQQGGGCRDVACNSEGIECLRTMGEVSRSDGGSEAKEKGAMRRTKEERMRKQKRRARKTKQNGTKRR